MPTEEKIKEKASNIRQKLGVDKLDAPDMTEVLRELKNKAKKFDFVTDLEETYLSPDAVMDNDTGIMHLKKSVFVNAKSGSGRDRFTIAHELGHFFIGHIGANQRNKSGYFYSTKQHILEKEANQFASYFLVPYEASSNLSEPQIISDYFQVSYEMAQILVERNYCIKRKLTGEMRAKPQCVIDFLAEKSKRET
jgi:Zn-dependent peptidase ImmA (M78 family)